MINFGNFTDVNGLRLNETVLMIEELPPQIGSALEAQSIKAAGKAATGATGVLMSSNFAANVALSASLSQVWSLLNS